MLPRANRLSRRNDFKIILRGKRINTLHFSAKLVKNSLPVSRFALIIPSRLVRSAVKRNYLKRTIREAIRNKLKSIKKGVDVIVILSSKIEKPTFDAVRREIFELFLKAGLLDEQ